MSDTPRTDSMEPYGPPYNGEESGLIHVPKTFARQLERELNQWRSIADTLFGALDCYVPARNCSCHLSPPCNDCVDHGYAREALEAFTEKLKGATK